jgi:predicted dehydrogenase
MSQLDSKPPLRVGLVGAGWVTQHHLAAWAQRPSLARVVAIADSDPTAARARADQHGIEHVFSSAQSMLAGVELDALDIAAPREFHADLVRLGARHGLAVLCQKPLAPTLAEAQALVAELDGRCRLMVHENWRFRAYYRDLAGWLAQGRIGTLLQAQMSLLSSGLIADAQDLLPALVRQPFIAGLDRAMVMEILIHHIDTLRFLLGDLAMKDAIIGRASAAMKAEDHAFILMQSGAGAAVALIGNMGVHGYPPAAPDRLTLIGSKGTIELEGPRLRCLGEQPAELSYDLPACYLASYAATIGHFVDAVRSGSAFETSPADNLKTLALVEAVYDCHERRVAQTPA